MQRLSSSLKQYLLITANYWSFTLTDGALRMLVILYFHHLGYSPLAIATLFLFYEVFGIITNLVGGWLGAYLGLNKTMNIGLGLQLIALSMLLVPTSELTVLWVMVAQAISGIAKDLNKMSAKSAIKLLVNDNQQSQLYRWVALLTGSKNSLKGIGFFLGGLLLTGFDFQGAIGVLLGFLFLIWLLSLITVKKSLGKTHYKPKFNELLSKSPAINYLSLARMMLFGARDIWFVVALPLYLSIELNWSHQAVSGFIALWIIAYGVVQSVAPYLTGKQTAHPPDGKIAFHWAALLTLIPALLAFLLIQLPYTELILVSGLFIFGAFFAINSSLHSYLIVSYAKIEGVSLDIGFYYMANATGRLVGTLLSGYLYQEHGLIACLWLSSLFLLSTTIISLKLPQHPIHKR